MRGSVRLDIGRPDHLAPLLGFVCDELAEVSRRAGKDRAAEVDESRLQLRIVETSVDLTVKSVDDLNGRLLGCTDAKYRARFVTWDEVAYCRDVWQPLPSCCVVTANGRNLPALICSTVSDVEPNRTCTCPPSKSLSTAPPPRYGT